MRVSCASRIILDVVVGCIIESSLFIHLSNLASALFANQALRLRRERQNPGGLLWAESSSVISIRNLINSHKSAW